MYGRHILLCAFWPYCWTLPLERGEQMSARSRGGPDNKVRHRQDQPHEPVIFTGLTYRDMSEGLLTGANIWLKGSCITKAHPCLGGSSQKLGTGSSLHSLQAIACQRMSFPSASVVLSLFHAARLVGECLSDVLTAYASLGRKEPSRVGLCQWLPEFDEGTCCWVECFSSLQNALCLKVFPAPHPNRLFCPGENCYRVDPEKLNIISLRMVWDSAKMKTQPKEGVEMNFSQLSLPRVICSWVTLNRDISTLLTLDFSLSEMFFAFINMGIYYFTSYRAHMLFSYKALSHGSILID